VVAKAFDVFGFELTGVNDEVVVFPFLRSAYDVPGFDVFFLCGVEPFPDCRFLSDAIGTEQAYTEFVSCGF
jgi:hypothetical protein